MTSEIEHVQYKEGGRSHVFAITKQELAGQMSEAQIQLAVKASGVGMWDWDLLTNELVWTDQEKTLFGLPPDTPISYERFQVAVSPVLSTCW